MFDFLKIKTKKIFSTVKLRLNKNKKKQLSTRKISIIFIFIFILTQEDFVLLLLSYNGLIAQINANGLHVITTIEKRSMHLYTRLYTFFYLICLIIYKSKCMIDIYIMKKFHMYMSFFPPGLRCTIVYIYIRYY